MNGIGLCSIFPPLKTCKPEESRVTWPNYTIVIRRGWANVLFAPLASDFVFSLQVFPKYSVCLVNILRPPPITSLMSFQLFFYILYINMYTYTKTANVIFFFVCLLEYSADTWTVFITLERSTGFSVFVCCTLFPAVRTEPVQNLFLLCFSYVLHLCIFNFIFHLYCTVS